MQSAGEKSRSMNAEIIARLRGNKATGDITLSEKRFRQIIQEELKKSQ